MSLGNYGSISHRLGAMDPQSFYHDDIQTDNRRARPDKGEAAYGVALKSSYKEKKLVYLFVTSDNVIIRVT